jgi:hypothetical protein
MPTSEEAAACKANAIPDLPRQRPVPVSDQRSLQPGKEHILLQLDNGIPMTASVKSEAPAAEVAGKKFAAARRGSKRTNGSSLMEFEWRVEKVPTGAESEDNSTSSSKRTGSTFAGNFTFRSQEKSGYAQQSILLQVKNRFNPLMLPVYVVIGVLVLLVPLLVAVALTGGYGSSDLERWSSRAPETTQRSVNIARPPPLYRRRREDQAYPRPESVQTTQQSLGMCALESLSKLPSHAATSCNGAYPSDPDTKLKLANSAPTDAAGATSPGVRQRCPAPVRNERSQLNGQRISRPSSKNPNVPGTHPGMGLSGCLPTNVSMPLLCPCLVVPQGMEFVFAVREAISKERQKPFSFNIVDLAGNPLCHAIVSEQASERCGIYLEFLDKEAIAHVNTAPIYDRLGGMPEICCPGSGHNVFCHIARCNRGSMTKYVLQSSSGECLVTFTGNFKEKAINGIAPSGMNLCYTRRCTINVDNAPQASYYEVRVRPSFDAGLLLCGLLAIDKLEGSALLD